MIERGKKLHLPEAQDDCLLVDWQAALYAAADDAEDDPSDPWEDRPDLFVETAEEDTDALLYAVPALPAEPCPCCGADIPENPSPGYICPVCGWEIDPFAADAEAPSDQNHGLSLSEAQLNFRVFGICDPRLRWETDE